MNDTSGHWIPSNEEDGVETSLELFARNVRQRVREIQTKREDAQLEIPVADARRRLVEAR